MVRTGRAILTTFGSPLLVTGVFPFRECDPCSGQFRAARTPGHCRLCFVRYTTWYSIETFGFYEIDGACHGWAILEKIPARGNYDLHHVEF